MNEQEHDYVDADAEYENMRDHECELLQDKFETLLNEFYGFSPYYKGRPLLLKQHLDSFFKYWNEGHNNKR